MPKARLTINTNLKLFPAVLVNSGMSALNLVKETLSDEILLIVASELIANVPSYLAWNCAVGMDEGALLCWKNGEGEGGHWASQSPQPQCNIHTTWLCEPSSLCRLMSWKLKSWFMYNHMENDTRLLGHKIHVLSLHCVHGLMVIERHF